MTIEWLAGNRLRGTTAERPALGFPSGSVGGWVEVGRTTLGSAGNTIDVTSLADKRYYMVLTNILQNGDYNLRTRMNGDSGSNYSYRESANGASDTTSTSTDLINFTGASNTTDCFNVGYAANLSSKEKLWQSWLANVRTAGAGTAPYRGETVGKHAQTSNPISQFNIFNNYGSNKFASGSEVVVLGWDPTDTHTTNFWEELASVDWSSGDTISSGTISAKKYLWVELRAKSGASAHVNMIFNSDTGSNYASRQSSNGGSENTSTSQSSALFTPNYLTTPQFMNHFIINNTSNEKISIGHTVRGNAAGTAPSRTEVVNKWANTSNQITQIDAIMNSGNFTGGTLKVWGAD